MNDGEGDPVSPRSLSAQSKTPPLLSEWLRDGVSPDYDPRSVDWVQTSDDFAIFLSELSHSVHYEPERWSRRTVEDFLHALRSSSAGLAERAGSNDRVTWMEAAAMLRDAMGPSPRDGAFASSPDA